MSLACLSCFRKDRRGQTGRAARASSVFSKPACPSGGLNCIYKDKGERAMHGRLPARKISGDGAYTDLTGKGKTGFWQVVFRDFTTWPYHVLCQQILFRQWFQDMRQPFPRAFSGLVPDACNREKLVLCQWGRHNYVFFSPPARKLFEAGLIRLPDSTVVCTGEDYKIPPPAAKGGAVHAREKTCAWAAFPVPARKNRDSNSILKFSGKSNCLRACSHDEQCCSLPSPLGYGRRPFYGGSVPYTVHDRKKKVF